MRASSLFCALAMTAVAMTAPAMTAPAVIALAAAPVRAAAQDESPALETFGYERVDRFAHDPQAFTQGFLFHDGHFYESTGRYGQSTVRKVEVETGEVIERTALPDQVFGEGLALRGDDQLVVLTWREQVGFVIELDGLQAEAIFRYPGQGWGLTTGPDGRLYMSDGSDEIRVLDPETLTETGRIAVTAGGEPLGRLNELEWIEGEIWANVWQDERIARIDPETGDVTAWVDLTGLREDKTPGPDDVLNGIAWDAENERLFVTGKLWPHVYEIELTGPGEG